MTDAKAFALRILRLSRFLNERGEKILAAQILRSGTSIGANLAEAAFAQTKADFVTKTSIALKEASETAYWLELLHGGGFISKRQFASISGDAASLLARLCASVLTAKRAKGKEKDGCFDGV